MKKIPPKIVMALLRKNNITLEKRTFENFVKDLAKSPNPEQDLNSFIEQNKVDHPGY